MVLSTALSDRVFVSVKLPVESAIPGHILLLLFFFAVFTLLASLIKRMKTNVADFARLRNK